MSPTAVFYGFAGNILATSSTSKRFYLSVCLNGFNIVLMRFQIPLFLFSELRLISIPKSVKVMFIYLIGACFFRSVAVSTYSRYLILTYSSVLRY